MPIAIQNKTTKKYMVSPDGSPAWGYVSADSFTFNKTIYKVVDCEVPPTPEECEAVEVPVPQKVRTFLEAQKTSDRASLYLSGIAAVLSALDMSDVDAAKSIVSTFPDSTVKTELLALIG